MDQARIDAVYEEHGMDDLDQAFAVNLANIKVAFEDGLITHPQAEDLTQYAIDRYNKLCVEAKQGGQ